MLGLRKLHVCGAHFTFRTLARRLNIRMLKTDIKNAHWETRGVYVSSTQALKEQAFPTLLSGPFANMTLTEMRRYAWKNMTKEKTLDFPSYRDFVCHQPFTSLSIVQEISERVFLTLTLFVAFASRNSRCCT